MEKVKYVFLLIFLFTNLKVGAQNHDFLELIRPYYEDFLYDSVTHQAETRKDLLSESLAKSSKLNKIRIYRLLAMSYLYAGREQEGRAYAKKVHQTDPFYEPEIGDSEELKSLLRKHRIVPKFSLGIHAGPSYSNVRALNAPVFIIEGWSGKWDQSKSYSGNFSWQSALEGEYRLNRFLSLSGRLGYQTYGFQYTSDQKYTSPINYNWSTLTYDKTLYQSIETNAEQTMSYYFSQINLNFIKHFEKLNTDFRFSQGLAYTFLTEAYRVAGGKGSSSAETDTKSSFYKTNPFWMSELGARYKNRHLLLGIDLGYVISLLPISHINYVYPNGFGLSSDYYDVSDRLNLQNLQINFSAHYTFSYRVK